MRRQAGYTLVELVVVLVLAGILAATLLPRFFDRQPYDEAGFYQELLSAARYAHTYALASGCNIQLRVAGGAYALQGSDSCTGSADFNTPVIHPSRGDAFAGAAPQGVNVNDFTVYFDALGRASAAQNVTVGSRSFVIDAQSGHVVTP